MSLKPNETHALHGGWHIIQHDGWYETGFRQSDGKFYDRHSRTDGWYTPPVVAPMVAAPVETGPPTVGLDAGYRAHQRAMDNDLNYRDHFERGGLIRREDR